MGGAGESDFDVFSKRGVELFLQRIEDDGEIVFLHLLLDVFHRGLAFFDVLPFYFAEVRHQHDPRAFLQKLGDGRDRGGDAVVIADGLSLVGNVEINADEDFLAV